MAHNDEESFHSAPSSEPVRDSALYYEDGDIVLSAKDDAETTHLFRIDKIFLKRHSPVFTDMLSNSPESELREEYDGVPVVQLSDAFVDVAAMLRTLYDW
jgi:hypothetical protein